MRISDWSSDVYSSDLLRANRRYFERYRSNGKIMGVIEEVSRYDDFVNDARMRLQKHFADRAEQSLRRLQAEGKADPDRKSVVSGKSVSISVDTGVRRSIKT